MEPRHNRLKWACYTINLSMSVVANMPPVLFLTFRQLYGISYTLLGSLIVIGFFTQLVIDLIFSFFSHKFNIPRVVKLTPVITVIGLLVYALWPLVFPQNVFVGLCVGTVIFSAAGGLCEVLISPVIAAIPSPDPDREMSKLHSVYAWGVVGVIVISTAFLAVFGGGNWQWLAIAFMAVPLSSLLLFHGTEIPKMETPERVSGAVEMLKKGEVWLCFAGIFLGGAAECTMSQWSSSYLERALGIPKTAGDIFGVAVFAVMLGLGRTLYSKLGKNIGRVLTLGALGATACYITAAVSGNPWVALIACAATGFCVSMLWPGSLIAASARIPQGGVFIYALMAAGGDLGASVAPQLVGVITDTVMLMPQAATLAADMNISAESLGMKAGMLVAALFPLAAVPVFIKIKKRLNKTAD